MITVYQLAQNREQAEAALICSLCQFPWCKYSHHGQFQVNNLIGKGVEKKWAQSAHRSRSRLQSIRLIIKPLIKIILIPSVKWESIQETHCSILLCIQLADIPAKVLTIEFSTVAFRPAYTYSVS